MQTQVLLLPNCWLLRLLATLVQMGPSKPALNIHALREELFVQKNVAHNAGVANFMCDSWGTPSLRGDKSLSIKDCLLFSGSRVCSAYLCCVCGSGAVSLAATCFVAYDSLQKAVCNT